MNNTIRPLTRDDLDRVGFLAESNGMFPADMLDGMVMPFLKEPSGDHRWLVFDQERVDGVAYYVPEALTEGTWNLLMIAVDSDRHGQGIGTALMRFVERQLADQGQRILLVETSGKPEFEHTRAFYTMLGYEREERIRDFYAAGDDQIVFRKALL